MDKIIAYIFFDMQGIAIFLSFFVSLKLINNNKIPAYMKGFYWYPIVAVLVYIPCILALYTPFSMVFAARVINFSILFHFTFLSIFIIRVISNQNNFFLKVIFWVFLTLIVYSLLTNNLKEQSSQTFSISSFGLTIFCIIYYYHLFKKNPILNLKREPSFWVVTGIFFTMSLNIPILAILDYLYNKINLSIYRALANVTVFSYTVMYIFFTKAMLCSVQEQKV